MGATRSAARAQPPPPPLLPLLPPLLLLLASLAAGEKIDFQALKQNTSSPGITLTFAFDSTGSMSDELKQVKQAMQEIFDYMKVNRAGEIANFALVEFNDPYAELLTITTDAQEYRKKLSKITVDGGNDCPEMAMKGIQIALENSLPNSYIFVFTDASAKDYYNKEEVQNLIQRKKSKVIFVLTGKCGSSNDPGYLAYNDIAKISNGHVFNLLKNEVIKVLEFVKLDTGKKGVINAGDIPSHKDTSVKTTVDETMKELTVTVTGKNPKIEFTDPIGEKEKGETVLDLDSVKSKQVKNPMPGNWTVDVKAESPGRFVIMTESSFNFMYGFSVKSTENIEETAPRPLIGRETALLIQVANQSGSFQLTEAKIKDTEKNVIKAMTLHSVLGRKGTYQVEPFFPPTSVFLLEVSGKDSKGNIITRISDSGITPQYPAPPIITLESEQTATLKSPFTLECHIESLVPFTACWYKDNTKITLDKSFSQSALFVYYIKSTSLSTGGLYSCFSKNIAGSELKNVTLNLQVPPPSVRTPEITELILHSIGEIPCHVESDLESVITWSRKGGAGLFQKISGSRFTNSPSGNLLISSVIKDDEGKYQCSAENMFGTGKGYTFLKVIEPVTVSTKSDKLKFRSYEHLHLTCSASGSEPIKIVWKKNGTIIQDLHRKAQKSGGKQVMLKILFAEKFDAGIYECEARNKISNATDSIELIYVEKPKVKIHPSLGPPLAGTKFELHCLVTGSPKPTVSWLKDGNTILSTDVEQVFSNGTLAISILTFKNTGQYQCVAENEVGKDEAKFNIDVVSAPVFKNDEKDIDVEIYKNTLLTCNVNGHPYPKIKWKRKDDKPISKRFIERSSCSMFISGALPDDEGSYIVTASNEYGERRKEFKVHITGLEKPILAQGDTEELSIAGKEKVLTCVIQKGNPPPTLTWFKDGEILQSKELSKMEGKLLTNASLIFSYITPDNEGTYDCVATNIAGETRRSFNLKVHEAPVFIDSAHTILKARKGTAVPLSCEVYGNPKPTVTWKKDNKPIIFSPFVTLNYEDGSLHILSVSLENNGTYECSAINTAGENKKTIDLLVQDPPQIHSPSLLNTFIEKGGERTLLCEVDAHPPAIIKWFRNGSPYASDSISYSPNNSSLSLTAHFSSSGEYVCLATNEAGSDKISYSVTVTVAPFFEKAEESIQVSAGDNVTLSCYTDAIPPAVYYWSFAGSEPEVGTSMVILESVNKTFAGLYRCDVTNIAGHAHKNINLTMNEPPKILADIPKNYFTKKGTQLRIPCYAEGDPRPEISWLKNGTPFPSTGGNGGILEINNVTEEDSGIYTCVAENIEGLDTVNTKLIVQEKPSMDLNYLKSIQVNETSSVFISCPVIGGTPSPQIQWMKDGVPITATRRVSPKDKKRSLHIKKTKLSDEGTYTCVASNIIGTIQADISLQVFTAPQFINKSINTTVYQLHGTTMLLDCSHSGKPTPQVIWYKNDHPMSPLSESRIWITPFHMTIKNTTRSDQAKYKCVVQSKAGQIERTYNVKIPVSAVEEGYISTDGLAKWEPWSSWGPCSASCGKSEKMRSRKCSSNIATCEGQSEEWQKCFVAGCKVDGNWSPWGKWSECSVTCGTGARFRERLCNNPIPEFEGKICYGANRQHEACNINPCPIDGSWASWSHWKPCSGLCSNSVSKRVRKCTNPLPTFGGKNCTGSNVEYEPCTQENCPVHGGWSEWSDWSPCSATCGHSMSVRERLCNNPTPELDGDFCTGPNTETRSCETELCDKIPTRATFIVNGVLNEHKINGALINVNITDSIAERLIMTQPTKFFKHKLTAEWYPYLSLVIFPVTWLTAYQKGYAMNGYSLTKGSFRMQTFIKYSSGENVTITHIGKGVHSKGELILQADIQGRTPLFPKRSPVKIEPYQEEYIQSGPGELFVSSRNTIQGGGVSIPYKWNKTIYYNSDLGQLPSLIETLEVKNIQIKRSKQKEESSISIKPVKTCPEGFELHDGGFCKDIDECLNRRMHNCHFTQTCVNLKGTYMCMCPPGFKASVKGGKCIDVNECTEYSPICSHKCENLEGSFKCLCPPGWALLKSKTNCTSILPVEITSEEEIENWDNCMPNQIEVNGICEDENPCEANLHMCGNNEICVAIHGLYRCIPVPCPQGFTKFQATKSCIKYCHITKCSSGAIEFEMVTPIILTPEGPIAPYKDLVNLPLDIDKKHLPHTSYQVLENEKGKPFRVKNQNGIGVIYSTVLLPTGQEHRIIILATTYDTSHTNILFSHKFNVLFHLPA